MVVQVAAVAARAAAQAGARAGAAAGRAGAKVGAKAGKAGVKAAGKTAGKAAAKSGKAAGSATSRAGGAAARRGARAGGARAGRAGVKAGGATARKAGVKAGGAPPRPGGVRTGGANGRAGPGRGLRGKGAKKSPTRRAIDEVRKHTGGSDDGGGSPPPRDQGRARRAAAAAGVPDDQDGGGSSGGGAGAPGLGPSGGPGAVTAGAAAGSAVRGIRRARVVVRRIVRRVPGARKARKIRRRFTLLLLLIVLMGFVMSLVASGDEAQQPEGTDTETILTALTALCGNSLGLPATGVVEPGGAAPTTAAPTDTAPPAADGTPTIMGASTLTTAQIQEWWRGTGKGEPGRLTVPIDDLIAAYIAEGTAEGVRGDIAFAQAVHETGYFSSGDTSINNYAGIGHPDGAARGTAFPDAPTGVRAHIQLLKKFSGGNGVALANPDVAPGAGARASTFGQLGGTWASNRRYWPDVQSTYLRMSGLDAADSEAASGLSCAGAPGSAPSAPVSGGREVTTANGTVIRVVALHDSLGGQLTATNGLPVEVNAEIAAQVQALFLAAEADPMLGGDLVAVSTFRSPEHQIELWNSCDASCRSRGMVARPGSSMHEQGKAIDFGCGNGELMGRGNKCYDWLVTHAPTYGLRELCAGHEPWHWSSTCS